MKLEPQSVSTLTKEIKEILENQFLFVFVKGEVSNFKQHSSGHIYLTLKDANASINCIVWKNTLKLPPISNGDVVSVQGRLTLYASSGSYQLIISQIEKYGIGDFYKEFLKTKQALLEKGYFDDSRKQPLPEYPTVIGVVTSETGAVLQDIIVTVKRRYPLVTLLVRPTIVQGSAAEKDIVQAINDFQKIETKPDVLIIARGGGSIEDLWCFNSESVATAMFNCPIPIISAIGHETDTTIADLVADKRANTPTAAAELATPNTVTSISDMLYFYEERIREKIDEKVVTISKILENSISSSLLSLLKSNCATVELTLQSKEQQLRNSLQKKVVERENRLVNIESTLKASDPTMPFHRGFAIIKSTIGIIEKDMQLREGETIAIERLHFTETAVITKTTQNEKNK
ncbi:MAG: exodeoxyribonuclease VII large subunit [Candidatus Kapabacteria bacterium]|nr:exodeoxyribonuclease VII large subunit [Candidatus Kapabacteria bacterium]